jgi:hypothetical protein
MWKKYNTLLWIVFSLCNVSYWNLFALLKDIHRLLCTYFAKIALTHTHYFFTEFLRSGSWSFQQNASFEQVHNTSSCYISTAQHHYKESGHFGCPRCLKTYRHFRNLKRHLKLECGKEPQFQCPFCPRRITHNADLKKHIKRMHLSK